MDYILFIISTSLTILMSIYLIAWLFINGFKVHIDGRVLAVDSIYRARLWMAVGTFATIIAHELSSLTILRSQGVEVFATQPLVLLCTSYIIFTMHATTILGRRHHTRLSTWVLLLQLPIALLFINILMLSSGNYRPLFDNADILAYQTSQPIVFYGRMIFISLALITWFFAIALLVDAWLYDKLNYQSADMHNEPQLRKKEHLFITLWGWLLPLCIIPFAFQNLWLHITANILMFAAMCYTQFYLAEFTHHTKLKLSGKLFYVLIEQRVPKLLKMERGGNAPWGTHIDNNPFYTHGNPTLDEIAYALGVERYQVSEYIHKYKNTSVLAWTSEQRMQYCANEMLNNGRKPSEIAEALQYNDLATFNHAFKRFFGMSPRQYIKYNKYHTTDDAADDENIAAGEGGAEPEAEMENTDAGVSTDTPSQEEKEKEEKMRDLERRMKENINIK